MSTEIKQDVLGSGEINIKVKDQNSTVICFKLKKSTKMKRLMESYCQRHGYAAKSVRFIYEGEAVQETDTPEGLKMEDNDEIDAVTEQHGGGDYQ